jgi:uncharacterized membrane protein
MRLLLCTLLLMLIGGTAQAQLTLCNRAGGGKPIDVAYAEENKGTLQIVGWKRIAPNACVRITTIRKHAYAYYAYAPGTDWEWEGDDGGEEFCVHMNRGFRIDYDGVDEEYFDADEFDCPPGAEKRLFMILESGIRHTIDLD